jgi:4F5 protein related disordered region
MLNTIGYRDSSRKDDKEKKTNIVVRELLPRERTKGGKGAMSRGDQRDRDRAKAQAKTAQKIKSQGRVR